MKIIYTTLLITLVTLTSISLVAAESAPSKKGKTTEAAKSEGKKAEKPADTSKAEAETITKALTPAQKTKLLEILNKGDEAALTSLPGVGSRRADAIKKARPFAAPSDLISVKGIGEDGLSDIVAHAKAGFPTKTKPETGKKPAETKADASKSKAKAKTKAKDKSPEGAEKEK